MPERLKRLALFAILFALATAAAPASDTPVEPDTEAVERLLGRLASQWQGTIDTGGDPARPPLRRPMRFAVEQRDRGGYLAEFAIGEDQAHAFVIRRRDGEGSWFWGPVGDDPARPLWMPSNPRGRLEKTRLIFDDETGGFALQLDNEAGLDLWLQGRLPGATGIGAAHLQRAGFRVHLGFFEITLMECLGIFATLFFASRFVVQWFASERAKKSVVPELFWWISLGGAMMMMIYGIYFGRFAVVFGQLTGWAVYIRNIWLIEREKRRSRHGVTLPDPPAMP